MKKFNKVYKEKKENAERLNEKKILRDFQRVYNKLLESYQIADFYDLNEKYQTIFLKDLNKYWAEEEGLTESGKKFLQRQSVAINENSSALQKKNFLKKKARAVINETLWSSSAKYKLYDVIDEMYHSIQASKVSDILSPKVITEVIQESFASSLNDFMKEIHTELYESDKEAKTNQRKEKIQESTRAKSMDEEVRKVTEKYRQELNEGKVKEKMHHIAEEIKDNDDFYNESSGKEIDKIAKQSLSEEDYAFYKENKGDIQNLCN